MDFRKIFDGIVDEFDKWRPCYCDELFNDIIEYSKLSSNKNILEIGPGTGQATEPFLKTGCTLLAVELGENLAAFTGKKFERYNNFQIVNADFETYNFGQRKFDLVFSAAAFQWIKEEIGYPKVYNILNDTGVFALFSTPSKYGTGEDPSKYGITEDPLYVKIQEVYKKYFYPETRYTCDSKTSHMTSEQVQLYKTHMLEQYGFINVEHRYFNNTREFNADDYVSYISTHADHITLQEPYKSKFYEGIKDAILDFDNVIKLYDTIDLYLARKP